MAPERAAQRVGPTVERRPAVTATVQRAAAAAAPSTARALQQRLGNQATQALARSLAAKGAARAPAPADASAPRAPRLAAQPNLPAKVSKPNEPGEREAEETARKVVRMTETEPVKPKAGSPPKGTAQREPAPTASPASPATPVQVPGGAPLPSSVRAFMEPRFGASFGNVRVHTGTAAADQSAALSARAFTVGEHVFFGRNEFQPHSASGRELIAHELTHTIQQGATVQRSEDTTITQRSGPRVQRWGVRDALNWIADKANYLPGFRLLTIVLGMNPINFAPVERSAANVLRALLEMIPGIGTLLAEALANYGIFAKVGAWVEGQVRSLGLVGSQLKAALDKFLNSLSWTDIFDLDDVYERGKRIFTEPIDRLIQFGSSLASDIIGFIREAILLPLGKLAEGTRGYDLLKAVLGQDPITGKLVPQSPEILIGGFMKFIGEEEVWENLKKANAVERAWAWFLGALKGLLGFVRQIPTLFTTALASLELIDLVLPVKAFVKIAGVFGGFAVQFVTWAGNTVWTLLEIIFEVVSPATLTYLRKTGTALKGILKNPLPFVRNLVRAAKLGFLNFADHFLDHLKAGLIDWLTGSLPGIYIPKAFSLVEIAKFVFSVLGLTWANIRQKLVKATSETVVKALETGLDIVVTLVRDGPAAAWDKIKEQLANLKDMVIGGITDFVVDMVVKKAIPKLIAMFIPGAGFISAILSIYDTIMVFVNKLAKIIQVVTGFIDSIVAIAGGAIGAAATRVENALAGLLSLAINFLAGFAGLGKVADQVMGVINKIRAPIDKALDWLVNWIVTAAKGLYAKGKAAVGRVLRWAFATRTFRDGEGVQHSLYVSDKGALMVQSTPQAARTFVDWYVKERNGDAKLAAEIHGLVAKAEKVIGEGEKAAVKDADIPAKSQQELLGLSTQISALLSKLVAGDTKIGKLEQKYLLEGQVGTYATIPKPVGDQLTPDHQPQASVILASADFFRDSLGIEGGDLAKRAEGRAAQGFAINLHFRRHVAGATYGSKGETREGFRKKLVETQKVGQLKKSAAKEMVVAMLRTALAKDVEKMKTVATADISHDAWKQLKDEVKSELKDEVKSEKKAQALKKDIAGRIVAGENQIQSQPFDF